MVARELDNSLTTKGRQTLAPVSAARAEQFLIALANLWDDPMATGQLKMGFPDILPRHEDLYRNVRIVSASDWKGTGHTIRELSADEINKTFHSRWALPFRDRLRSVWLEPDWRTREWRVFKLREVIVRQDPLPFGSGASVTPVEPEPVPVLTPFEQTLLHLLKSVDKARYCGNPDCLTPYFFAKRRSQKYCSDACSLPAQREFKRKWWADHGQAWRKAQARKASAKKSRRKRGN
jgi:hypothetical protein